MLPELVAAFNSCMFVETFEHEIINDCNLSQHLATMTAIPKDRFRVVLGNKVHVIVKIISASCADLERRPVG
jgi:hypothetical protein